MMYYWVGVVSSMALTAIYINGFFYTWGRYVTTEEYPNLVGFIVATWRHGSKLIAIWVWVTAHLQILLWAAIWPWHVYRNRW